VSRLFQIILQGAQLLNLGDPLRTGAGLPDAIRACLPHPLPAGMPLTTFPDISHTLQTGAPYFAGSPLGVYGMPASGGAPFPYIPFWAGGGQGPWAPTQSPESTWLLAIQQLKTAMQSAGLL